MRRLQDSEPSCFRQFKGFTLFDLLQNDGSIPQLVHSDPVTRQQMQSVSYGKRKQNPAIGINASNQAHSPDILVLDPGL
jgi:hypothetical protein